MLCFLEAPVLRFALLPYYRRYLHKLCMSLERSINQNYMEKILRWIIRLLLGPSSKSEKFQAIDKQTSSTDDEQTSLKEKTMDKLIINQENTLNAERLWCLRLVLTHENYNSCSDLAPLFQRMFSCHEIAEHFSLSKTKSKNTMLYGIAPEFKILNSENFPKTLNIGSSPSILFMRHSKMDFKNLSRR